MTNQYCVPKGQSLDFQPAGNKEPKWLVAGGRQLEPVSMPGGIKAGIMGIINLTPDSFYDGGLHNGVSDAVAHAINLRNQGADILDFGAESTRPGAKPVSEDEETARLLPVLLSVRRLAPGCTISIDTRNPSTAASVLAHGADVINDVSGLPSQSMIDVLATYKPGYVLTHSYGCPANIMKVEDRHKDIIKIVCDFFEQGMTVLVKAGIPENRIVLDPGIGFGKTASQNFCLMANAGQLQGFGRPVMFGLSMKSLFGELLGLSTTQRGCATAIATAFLFNHGILWHRVHDVISARQAITLAATMAGKNALWPGSIQNPQGKQQRHGRVLTCA